MPSISASKPTSPVTIDKVRQVRFNWSAANRFEEAYGTGLPNAMTVNVGTRLITYLVWAGLLHAEPALNIREVERRIQVFINNDGNTYVLAEQLTRALMDSGVLGEAKTEPVTDEAVAEGNEPAEGQE